MAFRIHDSVVRGEIDNRQKGIVRGKIWVHGRAEPVTLELRGNAHPDLAGCLLKFKNPNPTTPHPGLDSLHPDQRGVIGDLTASRKVRVPVVPMEEFLNWPKEKGRPPSRLGNCLYLEWFSEANGRVVIESADYELHISPPEWRLVPQEEQQRAREAADGFNDFMDKLSQALEAKRFTAPEDRPMDEFDWEKAFRENDAFTDKAMELYAKFGDLPNFDEILAREMGWDQTASTDADEDGKEKFYVDEMNRLCADTAENSPPPNPLTQGVDWIPDESGGTCHPLVKRIQDSSMALWHWCDERDLLGENGDADLHDMIFKFQCCGAKCAGGLAYNDGREGGFIVAGLKRALTFLNESLEAAARVESKQALPSDQLKPFREELFGVREAILGLMERFRKQT